MQQRDRPYFKRRDDRFNKYSKRHEDSRSRSSSKNNITENVIKQSKVDMDIETRKARAKNKFLFLCWMVP